MKIHELFESVVTRDIPPVVYFHEQSPAKVAAEVREYIITGGYREDDPRHLRAKNGIHEQFVHLLSQIRRELDRDDGPSLPASWISGFYGSGKSSFAKLLGLALDGACLPDGTPVATALLARDDSPKRAELAEAWNALTQTFKAFAVVFDIGGVARDDEHIHSAVLRQVQVRLGYCPKSNLVAEFELKLERDGEWDAFATTAQKVLGKSWDEAKQEEQAEDHFSHVLYKLKKDRYPDPTTWIDSRAGSRTGAGTSVKEVVEAIDAMIHIREPHKGLFIVVDEVSQYVHQDEGRMLKLQSFVSELGQRLKGRVWLLATGQQKLEESAETTNLGKLKDRFPANLRVHLGVANIRDVVHKRLLKKKLQQEGILRELYLKHHRDLRLYGYSASDITEDDFVEVYPMLPGQIDLLMRITSNLRMRSSRVQGDDHAIRGLLQLLGELFREQQLAEREVGELVTLDAIFEVQHSALEADVQTTLSRIFADREVCEDQLAMRVVKAVALLELIQEHTATTAELVAQCLYARLGQGNQIPAVTQALEKLRAASLLSYSEKQGYKIQSSAGQEWQREREDKGVSGEKLSEIIQAALKDLVGASQERARWKGRNFPWTLWFSDGRHVQDTKMQDTREDSTVAVDFRFLQKKEDRSPTTWVQKSAQENLRDRLVWIAVDVGPVEDLARQLGKSERMVEAYRSRRESLLAAKQRLLIEEEGRLGDLDVKVRSAVAEAFLNGEAYFRAGPLKPKEIGSSFTSALVGMATRILPSLYPHFSEIAVTPAELGQLLDKELSGPSTKFMDGGLGILSLDAGRYVASCTGTYPVRVVQEIEQHGGLSGQALFATFVSPPYGYPPDLVKACCAGLLRGKRIRIRPEQGSDITSYQDPGVRDLFLKDRDFRRAEFFPATEGEVSQRDRIAIRKLFDELLRVQLDPEDEPIADATFQQFPAKREQLATLSGRLGRLPHRPDLPSALVKLGKALEACCRSRQVNETVVQVKRNLDVLRDGFQQLGVLQSDLTEEALEALAEAVECRTFEVAQLQALEALAEFQSDAQALTAHLDADRPWRDIRAVALPVERLRRRYVEVRRALLNQQHQQAEAARSRVQLRPGFAQLSADEAHAVLRPIGDALVDTTPEAKAPALVELRDRFASRIQQAEEAANDLLDAALSRSSEAGVVKVEARVRGREVSSREQLNAVLKELEERVGPLVDKGSRVRLV